MSRFFQTLSVSLAVTCCALYYYHRHFAPNIYKPNLHPNVAYLDTADGGFSKGWKNFQRAEIREIFDFHMHIDRGCSTTALVEKAVTFWEDELRELDWARGVVLGGPEAFYEHAKGDTALVPFARLNYDNPDTLKLLALLNQYHVKGLKLHNRPLYAAKADYKLIDSPEWNAVYAFCGRRKLPILWHVNQRYRDPALVHGANTAETWRALPYTNEDVLALFLKIVEKHPRTDFVMAHLNFLGNHRLAEIFDPYPNLYADGSSCWQLPLGQRLTPQEIEANRSFLVRYAGRLLFGTDFSFATRNKTGDPVWWRNNYFASIHFLLALDLPQEVLDKITHQNAYRLLNIAKPDSGSN